MNRSPWLLLSVACAAQALATTISTSAGLFAGVCIGVYLAARLWFVDHPLIWWYDVVFWIAVTGVAVLAAALRTGICAMLPITGYTMRSCRSLSFQNATWLHLATIGGMAAVFWVYGHVGLWWGSQRR